MDSERKYYSDDSYLETAPQKELSQEAQQFIDQYKNLSLTAKIEVRNALRRLTLL